MIRVLLVSNMYAYPGNWDKLDALARHVQLEVITPARWATAQELHPVASVPRYRGPLWVHHPVATVTQGNPFRYIYRPAPLVRVLRRFRPDIVHVEQEPESLSLLQLGLLKRWLRRDEALKPWGRDGEPLHWYEARGLPGLARQGFRPPCLARLRFA